MKIQVNTDKNIAGSARLDAYVTESVENGLKHYTDRISRAEVHLSDQNADKEGANDMQCRIEARIEGLQPVLVESKAESHEKAINEAVKKMQAKMRTVIGKLKEKR